MFLGVVGCMSESANMTARRRLAMALLLAAAAALWCLPAAHAAWQENIRPKMFVHLGKYTSNLTLNYYILSE